MEVFCAGVHRAKDLSVVSERFQAKWTPVRVKKTRQNKSWTDAPG
jgi:hypothetical protein